MALTFYFINAFASGSSGHGQLQTRGTAPGTGASAVTMTTGWTVAKQGSPNYSLGLFNTDRAANTFSTTAAPGATLGTTDAFRTTAPLSGTFANANWTIAIGTIAGTAASGSGTIRFKVWRSVNTDGSSGTELTSGSGVLVTGTWSNLTTTTQQNLSVTWTPGGAFTLTNEYLFVQFAISISTASGVSGADVRLRQDGTYSKVTSSTFTWAQEIDDTVAVSDVLTPVKTRGTYNLTVNDTSVAVSDALTYVKSKVYNSSAADTVTTITESLTCLRTRSGKFADTIAVSDALTPDFYTPCSLWGFGAPTYQWSLCTATYQPNSYFGVAVANGNNTKGSWATLASGASVSRDVYGIQLNFNWYGGNAGYVRDAIYDIGVDPAGGTSYTVLISDLIASCNGIYLCTGVSTSCGINYFFPIWIKAGSQVAVRSSANQSVAHNGYVWARFFGAPRDKRNVKVGSRVITYGANEAASNGTAITSGTTSEGSYTTVGTIATGDNPWWWQFGMGCSTASTARNAYQGDLGIGASGSEHLVSERMFQTDIYTQIYDNGVAWDAAYKAKAGDLVRVRLQCSGTPDAGLSVAAYGVI